MPHTHKRLRPAEEDLHSILSQFTSAVSQGAQPSFSTFKHIWAKRHFSWIFLGNNTDLSTDKFVQSLYAISLDCLDIPIAEHTDGVQPNSETPQQQTASQHSAHPQNQADDQYLHEVLLGDDGENDHPDANTEADIRMGSDTDTDPHLNAADNTADDMDMANGTDGEGSSVKDSHKIRPSHTQPALAGMPLDHAGMERPGTLQMQNGFEAHQAVPSTSRPAALLLPPYAPLPLPISATAAAGAQHSHSHASSPDVIGHAPHGRPLADVSLLDALPDVPLRSPPSSGPKGPPQPLSPDIPMIEADVQLNSSSGVLHTLQAQQLPFTNSAAAYPKPALESSLPSIQSDNHNGPASPRLFMTEADLLLDSPGQPPPPSALHDQLPPASNPAEDNAGTVPQPSHIVQSVSAASLAARALQRQQNAPAIILSAAPAPLPAAAPAAAPNRNMYTKNTSYRRKPNPTAVPLETKVGSLYAIYCLHETQPGHVPVYLPLELLHQLLDVVKEAHIKLPCDVVQVVAQLMHKKAFVVGAVRRPFRDSAADEAALQPPNRMAASSLSGMDAKVQKERDAVYHLQSMYRGLTMVGALQGLCRQYKEAKAHSWKVVGVRGKPTGFANLTVGAKLAQLLHQATTKITPKIRPKRAGRPPRARKRPPASGQGEKEALPVNAQADVDQELDSLLESSFLELASDDEAPAARGGGAGPITAPEADSSEEEGKCSDSDQDVPADDGIPGMGFMGLGFGIDFADVANEAQQDDEFAEAVVPARLPPAAKRALERDRARRKRRYLAEKGWDAFQRRLEQQAVGASDTDHDMFPAFQPESHDNDSDFGPEQMAVSALDKLAHSPPPSQPLHNPAATATAKQARRVRFLPDEEACQAGATLTGLGAAAHGPRAGFIARRGEGSQGSEAQQQSNQSKKRGRPKGSKNRSKPEAASEAAGAGPAADSAPKTKTPRRPSAKKRKKASDQAAEGPSEPAELYGSDSVNSPVHASSQQAAAASPETSVPPDTGLQSAPDQPPRSSLLSVAASLAASMRQPPRGKQPPAQQAEQLRQQLPQQSPRQLQEAVEALTAAAPSSLAAASEEHDARKKLDATMSTIHDVLQADISDDSD